ncbi:MAG: DUF6580 family putative transport protein [Planctomycetaceae bacterium]
MTTETQVSERVRIPVFAAFVAYALLMRVLPYVVHVAGGMDVEYSYFYPWNFSPIFAMAIFGGAVFSSRLAILLPIALLFVSDVAIALLMGSDWGSYRNQPFTYATFAVLALCGVPLRQQRNVVPIATAGFGGAVVFFLISNFGVWFVGGGYSHPATPAGLLRCYFDGLPFFGLTLVSLAMFLPVLFSPLVLARTSRQADAQAVV